MQEQDHTLSNDQDSHGLSREARSRLLDGLQRLDDTVPPSEVWQRIATQARAEGLIANPDAARIRWLAGAAIAAAVVLTVLNVPLLSPPPADTPVTYTTPAVATAAPLTTASADDATTLNALMVQSRQIESDLRALPGQPSLVRVSTAATLTELEDRIAAVDYRLNHPDMRLSPAEESQYWQERVRLMNLLLNLRRAQSLRTAF